MRSGNFNASHLSLAAVERDLYDASVLERRRARKGEAMWDTSAGLAPVFPKDEKLAVRSVSQVFVQSKSSVAVDGGRVHTVSKRPLDTTHLIRRRQKNGLRPVTFGIKDRKCLV